MTPMKFELWNPITKTSLSEDPKQLSITSFFNKKQQPIVTEAKKDDYPIKQEPEASDKHSTHSTNPTNPNVLQQILDSVKRLEKAQEKKKKPCSFLKSNSHPPKSENEAAKRRITFNYSKRRWMF